MTQQHGAGFRVSGLVNRVYVNDKGTFAALTVQVEQSGRRKLLDVRGFDAPVTSAISRLTNGDTVEVTGSVDTEPLKDKGKNEIAVDGRPCWVVKLTAKAVKVTAPKAAPEENPHGDDDIDF